MKFRPKLSDYLDRRLSSPCWIELNKSESFDLARFDANCGLRNFPTQKKGGSDCCNQPKVRYTDLKWPAFRTLNARQTFYKPDEEEEQPMRIRKLRGIMHPQVS